VPRYPHPAQNWDYIIQRTQDTDNELNVNGCESYTFGGLHPARFLHWVQAEAPTAISYKFLNKGLHQQSSENSSNASLDEINFISKRYKDKAEWYTERLVTFLLENESNYPAYANPDDGLDIIQPDTRTYTTGMFLGRRPKFISLEDKYEYKRK
jgi:hypothetical protein